MMCCLTLLRQIGYLEARVVLVGMNIIDPSAYLRSIKEKGDVPWEAVIRCIDRREDTRGDVSIDMLSSKLSVGSNVTIGSDNPAPLGPEPARQQDAIMK